MHNEFEDDDFHFDNEDEDELGDYIVGTQRMPRHQLRSRPPIDFDDARHSTVSTNVGLPAFTAATHPLSRMSGSTLHSGLGREAAHSFPHKMPSSRPSVDVIASLTVSELCSNPHYVKLRDEFDHVSKALAMSVARGYAEPPAVESDTLVPDIYQGV